MSFIADAWNLKYAANDPRWLAYAYATSYLETAHTMQPIEEFGRGHGYPYGVPDPVTHQTYYGRGYVQLTWLANYRKLGQLLHLDLVTHPEMALDPRTAAAIMFEGMIDGLFTGRKLADYFNSHRSDAFGARRIINGTDHAGDIADYYGEFLDALADQKYTSD